MKNLDLSNTSVCVDRSVHDLYEKLVSRSSNKAEECPFATMKDLFMLCACIGAQKGEYREVATGREIFSGEIFSDETEVPILAALAFSRAKDIEVLSNPKQVIEIAQGWANGGIPIVREEVLQRKGVPLFNLVALLRDELDLD